MNQRTIAPPKADGADAFAASATPHDSAERAGMSAAQELRSTYDNQQKGVP
jgi:hypothetical protein